jgi:hypothetical protein
MKKVWLSIKWLLNSVGSILFSTPLFKEEAPRNVRPSRIGAFIFFIAFIAIIVVLTKVKF